MATSTPSGTPSDAALPARPDADQPAQPTQAAQNGDQAALYRARDKAAGHEAVCVSHQLPTATLRRSLTGLKLPHLPTAANRMCNHASLSSFYFHDDALVGWSYAELAGQ